MSGATASAHLQWRPLRPHSCNNSANVPAGRRHCFCTLCNHSPASMRANAAASAASAACSLVQPTAWGPPAASLHHGTTQFVGDLLQHECTMVRPTFLGTSCTRLPVFSHHGTTQHFLGTVCILKASWYYPSLGDLLQSNRGASWYYPFVGTSCTRLSGSSHH